MVSRRLNLSRERLRMFAPIGAAAGLAAAFNAPISAILFVVEEVIGRWSAAVLGSIVLSAISSVVVARWFWGAEPMFRIPSVTLKGPQELLAYAVLGVAGGIAALIFSKALGYTRPRLRQLPRWTWYIQPPIAGLIVGAIAFFGAPQVMGPGYNVIDQAMHGQFTWKFLLALALLKIVATTISFSSGTPGGMFAPTLFIGAMLGASIGTFEKIFFPSFPISVGSYALVGMGVSVRGFLTGSVDLGFHGARSQRQLLHCASGYSGQHHCLPGLTEPCSPILSLKPSPTRMASTCLRWRNSARKVCCIWRTPCVR